VNDQYLDGVDLDFSQTLFIATANEEADIPGPLRPESAGKDESIESGAAMRS
jgi:ATP-dependent Lon protease